MIKRSMIFIDANNLFSGWKGYCEKNGFFKKNSNNLQITERLGYSELIKCLIINTDLIRAYYYDAVPEPTGIKRRRFFDMLRSNEITVVTKKLKFKDRFCRHCMHKEFNVPYQKGVDVALVTDLMGLAFENAYDIAIII